MKAPLPSNEALRLETLRRYNVLDTPPEMDFDDMVKLAAQICQVPIAAVSLIDENRQWFKSIIGLHVTETSRNVAFCAHAILNPEELLEVRDAQLDLRFADNPLVTHEPHIRFYAGAPLITNDGLALGTLCVIDCVPRELSAEQKIALTALSRAVIVQLELRHLLAAYRHSEELLQSLNESLEQKVEARTAELRQEVNVRFESEQRFRQLSENIREVFWMTNLAKTNMLYISPAYEVIWGRTVQSIYDSPQSWLEAIHDEDKSRVLQAAMTEQSSGAYDEEYRIVRPNGDVRWIHDKAFPVHDSEGVVYRIVGVAEDITGRKLAEHKIQDQQARLNGLIEAAMDAIVSTDECQNIIIFNRAAEQIFGYQAAEIIGQPLDRLLPVQYRGKHRKYVDNFGKTSISTRVDLPRQLYGLRSNGEEFPFEASISVTKIAGGLIYTAILRDNTLRMLAEANLHIAATAFESKESMMITDVNRVILRVNRAFTESTGYAAEEIIGKTPRLLNSGHHKAGFYHTMWETINHTGTWQGEIWERHKDGEISPKWLTISAVKGSDGVVTHYVGSYIDITERKAAEEKIQYLGFYDSLTRLPNRRLFMDRLHQSLVSSERTGRVGALLFIDLDNFKTLNDTYGHQVGDLLLQQVAQRLESCVRTGDTVARLGGDEFVVMLENLSKHPFDAAAQTKFIGEKMLACCAKSYQLDRYEHHSTASIGATLFNDHHQVADELMKQADIAMYQAKKVGRNTLCFFDPKMQASLAARTLLEGELRKALEKQQFHLYYQIQMDSSYHPIGAEVLIRWIHPEWGMISSAQFISVAEETGLILPIGLWVLEIACSQIKAWQQQPLTRDLVLAVNVSVRQFHQADFVAQVLAIVQHHAINPMRLKLELTEGMLLENIEETITIMNILSEIGIQFSLDDFGTGYSSLQYLKRLPLDQLKIDQSFVQDIATDSSDKAIVRTIIAMAKSLGMSVIAEGVETEQQRQLLLENGCIHYQGYLFGKPVPIEQFETFLKRDGNL